MYEYVPNFLIWIRWHHGVVLAQWLDGKDLYLQIDPIDPGDPTCSTDMFWKKPAEMAWTKDQPGAFLKHDFMPQITFTEINIAPEKRAIFQPSIFRCHSFQGG